MLYLRILIVLSAKAACALAPVVSFEPRARPRRARQKTAGLPFVTARWGDPRFQQPGLAWGQSTGSRGEIAAPHRSFRAIFMPSNFPTKPVNQDLLNFSYCNTEVSKLTESKRKLLILKKFRTSRYGTPGSVGFRLMKYSSYVNRQVFRHRRDPVILRPSCYPRASSAILAPLQPSSRLLRNPAKLTERLRWALAVETTPSRS